MSNETEKVKKVKKSFKTSYQKVIVFRRSVAAYLAKYEEKTKFSFALQKVFEATDIIERNWTKFRDKVAVMNAATKTIGEGEDKKQVLSFSFDKSNQMIYDYTPEGQVKMNEQIDKEFEREGAVEVEAFYVSKTDIPADVERFRSAFTPFVLEEVEETI